MRGLVRLVEADESCGAKAATLGRLASASVAVPDGFVVPDVAAGRWAQDLPSVRAQLGASRFAVRSSAAGEDLEAVRGLGERVVAGRAAPQRWQTDAQGVLVASGTPGVLSRGQAQAVMDLAQRVEELLDGGQDIEWALDAEGVLWALQSRPITTCAATTLEKPRAGEGRLVASGTASSPGTARGRVRVLSGLDDFERFRTGEVLVCVATSPAWTPVLARAAAVVTGSGGILSHAAIVTRELRIPAVTDVPEAVALPEGALVVVNGTSGTIALVEES